MERTMRLVGAWMDLDRAKALRVVAAKHSISIGELMRRAVEAQYGAELDHEQARFAAPGVLTGMSKRSGQKS